MSQAYLLEVQTKQTKIGPMYDLVFDNGDKVGVGKYQPKNATPGKYYSYEFNVNGNFKNLAPGSLREQAAPPASSPQTTAAPARSSRGGGGFDARQDTISKQAAFNTALSLVKILQDADALPIAASVKKDKKADTIEAIVLDYAGKFYKRATGNVMDLGEEQDAVDLAAVEGGAAWDE